MNNRDIKQALRGNLDRMRESSDPFSDIDGLLKGISIQSAEELDQVVTLLAQFAYRRQDSFFASSLSTPQPLADFILRIARPTSQSKMLIPWADTGTIALQTVETCSPGSLTIYSLSQELADFNKRHLKSNANIYVGEPLVLLADEKQKFDLIFGVLPFGVRQRTPPPWFNPELSNDYEDQLIVASSRHLNDGGKLVFVVIPSFISNSQSNRIRNCSEKLGLNISAAIDLPVGLFAPMTPIPAVLIVIEKGSQGEVFSGLYSDNLDSQNQLLSNFFEQKAAKQVGQGYWMPFKEFKGNSILRSQERVERLASRSGLSPVPFRDLIINTRRRLDSGRDNLTREENSLYFHHIAKKNVLTSIEDIPPNPRMIIFQVVLDQKKVSAEYLAAFFNRSVLGEAVKQAFSRGSVQALITISALEESTVYIPKKETQSSVIDAQTKISQLRNELNELEESLWQRPNSVGDIKKNIASVNHEDTFISWVDKLPFPLASILWAYNTQTRTPKEKYEKLLHFFEATTLFMCVIHVSAVSKNKSYWPEVQEKIQEQMSKNNLRIETATFGTWLTIYEIATKFMREKINIKEEQDVVLEVYKTRNIKQVNSLLQKKFVSLFKDSVAIRNKWQGHSGAVSDNLAQEIHQKLQVMLQEMRGLFTSLWDCYDLVLPESSRYKNGKHHFTVKRIVGTRIPFERTETTVAQPLEDGLLHLVSCDTTEAIELIPIVQVVPGPKSEADICYFFNRLDGKSGEARFVSYHCEGDSEYMMSSDRLMSAIDLIKG
jgi:hypothetical protein